MDPYNRSRTRTFTQFAITSCIIIATLKTEILSIDLLAVRKVRVSNYSIDY